VWFSLGEGSLAVKVAATCDRPSIPSRSGFSWTVLAALTDELDMEVDGSTLFITLSRSRGGTDW
jgi:hypothetical protein